MEKKVFVLGIDSFEFTLAFENWAEHLPNLSALRKKSIWGKMQSAIPPLSCTAWVSFARGKNPGQSNFHGFMSRKNFSYNDFQIVNSTLIEKDRVWDILGNAGKKVIVINVPVTFPAYSVNGIMVSSFLTPNTDSNFTYPAEIKNELAQLTGDNYLLDVRDFKRMPKDELLEQLYLMAEQKFSVVEKFLKEKEWDFFILGIMATDRLQHAFWADMDSGHPAHDPNSEYKDAIFDYYKMLDKKIGELLELLDENTALVLMSDHGGKRMNGFFNINQWLAEKGYLKVNKMPETPAAFEDADINWQETKVFATGNYIARIFLNVKGREPNGMIERDTEYESLRNEIIAELGKVTTPDGTPLNPTVYKREEIYGKNAKYLEMQPDLVAHFSDFQWGANQMLGHKTLFSQAAEKGRNMSNHYRNALYAVYNSGAEPREQDIKIIDLAPTIFKLMNVPIPVDMEGKSVV